MNTEALDTLREILNSEMYEVWGLNANEPEQYEKCLSRLKEQVQQYVDSECLKARADELYKAIAHPNNSVHHMDKEYFNNRLAELNTGGIQDE